MDFEFSEDQQAVLDAVREFCEEELKPKAEETDASGEFPWENLRKMAELDLFGIPVSEEYGGLGMDFLTWAAVGMEISQACTTTGAVFGAHMLAQYPLMLFGTEEQKRKFLEPLCRKMSLPWSNGLPTAGPPTWPKRNDRVAFGCRW